MTARPARRRGPLVALIALGLFGVVLTLSALAAPGITQARLAYDLLGGSGKRRYLVLAQNPAELRPTGGYTGTVGTVAFDHLSVVERSFVDVYQIDLIKGVPFVPPPDALANHLLGPDSWQLADAAWSPDFPASAQNALRLYSLESGDTDIDGVIALNTYAVDRLLEVFGPINVPSYNVTVNPGEVTLTAMRLTRGVSNPTTQRKAFLNDLGTILIERMQHPSPAEAANLPMAMVEILRDRQLLAWMKDPQEQRQIAVDGFDGRVRTTKGDYLYVVEANVAPSSKYNLVVDRADALSVKLDEAGNATSSLGMAWQNNATTPGEPYDSIRSFSSSPAGLYGTYVRVLTPASSTLESTSGHGLDPVEEAEEVSTDAGRNVFGNYLLIGPGQANLAYQWSSPAVATNLGSGNDWTYQLTVQKQPGLRTMPFSVTVQLPSGATVTSAPQGASISDGSVSYHADLANDLSFEVRYRTQ